MDKLRMKLFISLLTFAVILVSVISFANRELLRYDVQRQKEDNQQLIEMHVLEMIKTIDKAHSYFGKDLDKKMEKHLKELANYYEENPNIYSWDLQQFKKKFGFEIFIFNQKNEIIHTTLKEDLGLNFSECCKKFSAQLDVVREGNTYFSEGLDTATRIGTVWKYGYYPTLDHQYLLEVGMPASKEQLFQDFNYVKSSKVLAEKYKDLVTVEIVNVNKEGYFLGADSNRSYRVEDQSEDFKKAYVKALETMQPQHYVESNKGHEITSKLIPYKSAESVSNSPVRIAFIQFSNQSEQELLKKNLQQFYILLAISMITAIALLIIINRILMNTVQLATYDSMTGALNRATYLNEMDILLKRKKEKVGLLLLDLDNFKKVNDSFGHAEGDRILIEVVQLLKELVKKEGLVIRLGGDEFAVIVFNASFEKLDRFANMILQEIRNTKNKDESWSCITASLGGALQEDLFESEPEMFKRADDALYRSKEKGKNCYTESRLQ